jgi:rod shape-determining protein MreC
MVNRKSGLSYKSWRTVHFAVILLFILTLILQLPKVNSFVSEVVQATAYVPFHKVRSAIVSLAADSDTILILRDSLASMADQLAALEVAERENVRLRSVLGFEQSPGYHLLPARVISITGEQLPVSASINRGLRDSVLISQPVINQVGLVGRVQQVMSGYAKVQLLTDPLNRVAGRVASSREMGIVRYLPSEGMILADFPNQGAIQVGDTILSSGLGGIYPPGLKVGVVSRIRRPENKPYSQVNLEPVVNFRTLEELFILLPESP